jgi:YfiH family protein
MNNQGFLLREYQNISYYSCRALESVPHLRHGFSTRRGGSPPQTGHPLVPEKAVGDLTGRNSENRRRFLNALQLGDAHLITLRQVHSNRVHIIKDICPQRNLPEGDAVATRLDNVALSVQVADCMPVLIADPVRKAVAAVHSGWRGTLLEILPQTIREMEKVFSSDPSTLIIAVGPGIRSCCFEVGQEVADRFEESYPGCCSRIDQSGKYHLDLGQILDTQMNLAGVLREHRHDMAACTRCNPYEFYSYRREGQAAGRMLAIIGFSRTNTCQ